MSDFRNPQTTKAGWDPAFEYAWSALSEVRLASESKIYLEARQEEAHAASQV